mgnify:CR=1 FL=1|tara:strand:- start:587 stop:1135 length:549 start_codon:yes stop_codon:yes gene_type:complete
MYVLGLDISTSCTGIAILHHSGKLQQLNYVDLTKCNTYWDKVDLFREEMKKILFRLDGPVQSIYIEESLQRFRTGMSSAKTLSTLTKFNGVVSFIARELTGAAPEYFNVNTARKSVGISVKRGENAKEKVQEWVEQQIDFNWPTKILKSGPRKGNEVKLKACEDMSDAYLIAAAGIKIVNSN